MNPIDLAIQLTLSALIIIGVYQLYFWCQRNAFVRPREFAFAIDARIPYRPGWVWIYSCLYYPVILYLNVVAETARDFLYLAASYVVLLGLQMLFFLAFPVVTPAQWRRYNRGRSWSERLLALVQRFDDRSNSFPSMHVSVATLTALHLAASLGEIAFAFPLLIAASCLYTKQHYVVDVPPGALLGWVAFAIHGALR